MSQIRLYLDEDAQRGSLVVALRNSSIDVITVSEAGRLGYPDDQQLLWASEQGRSLYSFNVKDFSRLHNHLLAEENTHPGIIVVPRQRYSVGDQLRGLLTLMATKSAEDMVTQLVYLSNYIGN
ncbi:DUF5615 family PIN-like protein [Kovacikia minuta CCNUW1]|uniref:DUF5615 family PIN-like protein n=1 Tax=Kovacikia minuta TaxID=2931930 RepID=UPI001CCB299A|nr:DUF5615 family PIN-like protein [Kovacikia minuta]UBF28056.1 DUF5615 family PIN-like protein [Kovacikia minuta CCNUW1]